MNVRLPLIEKKQAVFGLDIGHHEAKFVQLKASAKSQRLLGLGSVPITDGMVIDGIIAEPEQLAQVLQTGLQHPANGKISTRAAIIGLPQAHLFSRIITIPVVAEDKMADAVMWEAQQYIPMPVNDLYTDHEIVTTIRDEAGVAREYEVLLVAAPRAIVDSYLKFCELAHILPRTMEVSLMANVRALRSQASKQSATMMIDAGSVATDMAILTDNVRVTTTVAVGGDTLTQALVSKLKIKYDQAEELKIKFGLRPSDLQTKIQAALEPQLHLLNTELSKLIKYYEERSKATTHIKVGQIMITGGGSRMPGLAQLISQYTNLPVDISSPWDRQKTAGTQGLPANLGPIFTTAYGLALRGWK